MKFYFDTSIWLDFFENRDKPNLPKGEWAYKLLNKIVESDNKIIYSNVNLLELVSVGYSLNYINNIFKSLEQVLIFVESTNKQIGKARDLAFKRDIPKGDALHALIARDNNAILISLDHHFKKVYDIIKVKRPQDFI